MRRGSLAGSGIVSFGRITTRRRGAVALLAAALLAPVPVVRADETPSPAETYPLRESWSAVDSTAPNISHFAYRDLNRNGIYDIGDRPLARIAVAMSGPDGRSAVRRGNINGFVNFSNSLTATPVEIDAPGEYRFEVVVPDGWTVTSGNDVQILTYRAAPEARPGILADRVPVPVGLAPVLSIEGRIAMRGADGALLPVSDAAVSIAGPDGAVRTVALDAEGRFAVEAGIGQWTIAAMSADGSLEAGRTVELATAPARLSAIVLGETVPPRQPVVRTVDFETVAFSDISKMPNGEAGLNWTNLLPVANGFYGGEGYINATMSGTHVAYNTSGYPVTIGRADGFDFYGGYFGVAWLDAEGETLEARAYRGDTLVGRETFRLSALGPFWFDADWRGITRLELATAHYWQFVVDDMAFGVPEAPPPP